MGRVALKVCSMGPFQSPLSYNLKTGILHKLSVARGKCREEYSFDKDREEAAWDKFCDTYGLGGLDQSQEGVILAGKAVGGSGSSS